MAESVFTALLAARGLKERVFVASAAAHTDTLGEPPHRGTREKLAREGIPLIPHRARLMAASDGERYDYLIGMDEWNVRDMRRIVGAKNAGKVCKLLDFSSRPRAIADPWYTGNFDETYDDIVEGCDALLEHFKDIGKI